MIGREGNISSLPSCSAWLLNSCDVGNEDGETSVRAFNGVNPSRDARLKVTTERTAVMMFWYMASSSEIGGDASFASPNSSESSSVRSMVTGPSLEAKLDVMGVEGGRAEVAV